mgnify:CR=1 FL=1
MQRKYAGTPGKVKEHTILRPAMPDIAMVSKKVYAVDAPPENARKIQKLLFSLSPS